VKVALRAVHDSVVRAGEPADVWSAFVAGLVTDPAPDNEALTRSLRAVGLHVSAAEWRAHLSELGVLRVDGKLDEAAAQDVCAGLRLIGDSFRAGPEGGWRLVATVPESFQAAFRDTAIRHTAGVLLELLESTAVRAILATPYADQASANFLEEPILACGSRGASIDIITAAGHGQVFESMAEKWVGRARIGATFTCGETHGVLSVLGSHAKVLVVDGVKGYIGSANLTGAGLHRQVELGVEVSGIRVNELLRLMDRVQRLCAPRVRAVGGAAGGTPVA